MKFYKRDPDRALAGMAELTMKQRGAYNSLIDLLYSRDGNVPDDDRLVARMLSCHWREWAALKRQLIELGKVWVEDGKLQARRVQETMREAAKFSQEQSKRASNRPQESEKPNENNQPRQPPGNATTPIDRSKEERSTLSGTKKEASRRSQIPEDFTLSDAARTYAAERGLDAEAERSLFVNHHRSKGNVFADHAAAWRTWCEHAVQFGRNGSNGTAARHSPRGGGVAAALRLAFPDAGDA